MSLRPGSWRDVLIAAGFVLAVNVLGASPALLSGANTDWIDRPWFFPPEVLFPVAWTTLFTLMGIALFLVWRVGPRLRAVRVGLAAFAGQFLLNMVWTPVFFGLQRPDIGLVVILGLWVGIVATIVAFDRVDRRAAALLVPYLAWVSFAAVLNYAILVGIG